MLSLGKAELGCGFASIQRQHRIALDRLCTTSLVIGPPTCITYIFQAYVSYHRSPSYRTIEVPYDTALTFSSGRRRQIDGESTDCRRAAGSIACSALPAIHSVSEQPPDPTNTVAAEKRRTVPASTASTGIACSCVDVCHTLSLNSTVTSARF